MMLPSSPNPTDSVPRQTPSERHLKHWLLAAITIALLGLIILLPADKATPSALAGLSATITPIRPPAMPDVMPQQTLTLPTSQIQLGLFSSLAGAESVQQDIFLLGLKPRVEKRATRNGIRYVILLGPYRSEEGLAQIEARLNQASIEYFVWHAGPNSH